MSFAEKIIEFCISNRVSTTEVADALGKSGVLKNVLPINSNKFCVGKVRAVFTANDSNYEVHEQIRDVQKGEVVIIFAYNCIDRAIIGDLISKYILLYKGASAIVVNGLIRDAACIKREGYNVWSEGVSPLGCYNIPASPFPLELKEELIKKYQNGIAICDDGGVTIIPSELHNDDMLNKLKRIEMQEDIWFYCLDTLKWDTKKIVCDKAYLIEQEMLSSIHIDQLKELSKPLDEKSNENITT